MTLQNIDFVDTAIVRGAQKARTWTFSVCPRTKLANHHALDAGRSCRLRYSWLYEPGPRKQRPRSISKALPRRTVQHCLACETRNVHGDPATVRERFVEDPIRPLRDFHTCLTLLLVALVDHAVLSWRECGLHGLGRETASNDDGHCGWPPRL
jgi:hypothetical protein